MNNIPFFLFFFLTAMAGLQAAPQGSKNVPAELGPDLLAKIDAAVPTVAEARPLKPRRVLIFWKCEGYFHAAGISAANAAMEDMGRKTGAFSVTITDDGSVLCEEELAKYDALILNNTTKLTLSPEQKTALLDFVKSGGGLVGIHAATDNFYDWPEGAEMIGGQFSGHPWMSNGTWAVKIDDPAHRLTKAFDGQGFKINDELYQFATPAYSRERVRVLLSVDLGDTVTREVPGKKRQDDDYAVAWIRDFGKGRIFYCGLGHGTVAYTEPSVSSFLLTGIQYALGDLSADATPRAMAAQ